MDRIGGWNATASATAAIATATKAAVVNRQHVVYGLDASFNGSFAAPVSLQIKDGTTVIYQTYTSGEFNQDFPAGITITIGNAVSAVLASAGGTVIGAVNLHGATR
jgi:hypothetical protein